MDKKIYLTILVTNLLIVAVLVIIYRNSHLKKENLCLLPPDYNAVQPVRNQCLEDLMNSYILEYYHNGVNMNTESRIKISNYMGLHEQDYFKIASHNLYIKDQVGQLSATLNLEKFFLSLKIYIDKQLASGTFAVDSVRLFGKDRKMDVYFTLHQKEK